jgi:hypothetical protein
MTEATGVKYDTDKPRWSLLPLGTIKVVLEVLEYGARKYSFDNWKRVEDAQTRYYDACMRHLDAWRSGQPDDHETGKPHVAHAVCCLLFILWFEMNNK